MRTIVAAALVLIPALASAAAPDPAYTTAVKMEYVLGCMASNGQTPEMLQRCSCSIDAIAASLPYDTYETAETVMRMESVPGQQAAALRSVPQMKDAVDQLRRSQAAANQKCF